MSNTAYWHQSEGVLGCADGALRGEMGKEKDQDAGKGAVEQNSQDQKTNTSMAGQLPHRNENPLVKSSDSDFPEPGENEEHSGEQEGKGLIKGYPRKSA